MWCAAIKQKTSWVCCHLPRPCKAPCIPACWRSSQGGTPDTDFLLSTEEVATRLGKSTKWVRDSVENLPFAIRVGKEHRFSVRGLEEWIAEQRAVKMALALPPTRRQHER